MPFKKEKGKEFYQGINLLKSDCKKVIEHIDSTPAQILDATEKLMFLSAETMVDRNLHRLERLIKCMSKVGYRVTENDTIGSGEEVINNMALNMLKLLSSEEKDGVQGK
jgi:hypothetical protein